MRVLVAEDDTVSRTILRRAVERAGHEVVVAEDGEEAWRLYKADPDVDVVISDWMMPGVDGPELCARIRAEEEGTEQYTFFVFLTALGDRQHLLEGLRTGADDYLAKPLDRDELEARLLSASRVISLHRQLADGRAHLRELNARLFEQARHDPLTGLGNRLLLNENLETATALAERYGHGYCVVLFDVDFFKRYNDLYGHLAGDEVLKKVAAVAAESFRDGDTIYRYGGEEFLALLPEQTLKTAAVAAERLRRGIEALAIPHEAKDPPGVVTASMGIAELPPNSKKPAEALLKEADEALYRAKGSGRNRVAVYAGPPVA